MEVQLCDLLLRRGDVSGALSYLKKAHAHNPYNVNTMNILARAYMRAGQVKIADDLVRRSGALFQVQQRISVLEAQRKQRPLDRKVSEQLVELYTRNGQKDRAAVARDMVRQLQTDPRKAAEEVKNLNALVAAAGLDV